MEEIKEILPKNLKELIDSKQYHLIDVREPFEYRTGYIKNSINIPLPLLLDKIDEVLEEETKPIVMICRIGVRSWRACEIIISESFACEVMNLEGGVIGWEKSGYSLHKN